MNIRKENGNVFVDNETFERDETFREYIDHGQNGVIYCRKEGVINNIFHVQENGNDKTGLAVNVNFPIEYTCRHDCECYKLGLCYACQGCYLFPANQAGYSENYNYYKNATSADMLKTFQLVLDNVKNVRLWRYFTCGDIPDKRFLQIMVDFAIANPAVKFWSYTKKYHIVNEWIDEHGQLPENLKIIFSHWLNKDGTYLPMDNKHNLPTSEFIPLGQEHLAENVTHVCPCSDPNVVATCATCDCPCYGLCNGQSMALLEHSTRETKQRDKAIRESKKALKEKAKRGKGNGKTEKVA